MTNKEQQVYDEIRSFLSDRGNRNKIELIHRGVFDFRRVLESRFIFEHPLTDLCSISCYLWLERMGTKNYQPYVIVMNEVKDGIQTNNHHFIKNKTTNEIIDLTKEQYEGETIPYNKGIPCIIFRENGLVLSGYRP